MSDQAERCLYELERAAERLQRDVKGLRARGVTLTQGQTRLREMMVAGSIYNTLYGKKKGYWRAVRVLGCNGNPVAGINVRFFQFPDPYTYVNTDSDGYATYYATADSSVSVLVLAAGGYTNGSTTLTSTTPVDLQLTADSNHLCLAACSSPVLVAGQVITVGGSTTTAAGASGVVTLSDDVYTILRRNFPRADLVSGPATGDYDLSVVFTRDAGTGNLKCVLSYLMLTDDDLVPLYYPIKKGSSSALGTGTYYFHTRSVPGVFSSYSCGSLAGTFDFTGTDADTELGITSVEIADP
jgi:hypothetical protein